MEILRIFKYIFDISDSLTYTMAKGHRASIAMPEGARVLDVQMRHDVPCIWALVNPNSAPVDRIFRLYGTGHSIQSDDIDNYSHVGTFQMAGRALVFHLFEEKKEDKEKVGREAKSLGSSEKTIIIDLDAPYKVELVNNFNGGVIEEHKASKLRIVLDSNNWFCLYLDDEECGRGKCCNGDTMYIDQGGVDA